MTLRLYAERKGWAVKDIAVELSHERVHADDCEDCEDTTTGYIDLIRTYVTVKGDLTDEQGARLREIAGRCPVHKTLMARPKIIEELDVIPPDSP